MATHKEPFQKHKDTWLEVAEGQFVFLSGEGKGVGGGGTETSEKQRNKETVVQKHHHVSWWCNGRGPVSPVVSTRGTIVCSDNDGRGFLNLGQADEHMTAELGDQGGKAYSF